VEGSNDNSTGGGGCRKKEIWEGLLKKIGLLIDAREEKEMQGGNVANLIRALFPSSWKKSRFLGSQEGYPLSYSRLGGPEGVSEVKYRNTNPKGRGSLLKGYRRVGVRPLKSIGRDQGTR